MSDQMALPINGQNKPIWQLVGKTITGLLAIMVAIQAMKYTAATEPSFAHQDHLFRLIAFCSLTIWCAFTIGLKRSGMAAIMTLAFASIVDLLIVPARTESMGTLVAANLGIVIAYCSLQLYWGQLKLRDTAAA
ncbi:MAG: hypothetical protein ABJG15_18880 [Hyphomonadaceae bacterium]